MILLLKPGDGKFFCGEIMHRESLPGKKEAFVFSDPVISFPEIFQKEIEMQTKLIIIIVYYGIYMTIKYSIR